MWTFTHTFTHTNLICCVLFLLTVTVIGVAQQAEEHVRRLASELEALQDNAAAFGSQRTGLAGWYDRSFDMKIAYYRFTCTVV